jgi:hypothetical protein
MAVYHDRDRFHAPNRARKDPFLSFLTFAWVWVSPCLIIAGRLDFGGHCRRPAPGVLFYGVFSWPVTGG